MDTDITEISIIDDNNDVQFNRLGFKLFTPFRPNEVPNLRKFMCKKMLGRIIQEKEKKVSVTKGNLISFITQIHVT